MRRWSNACGGEPPPYCAHDHEVCMQVHTATRIGWNYAGCCDTAYAHDLSFVSSQLADARVEGDKRAAERRPHFSALIGKATGLYLYTSLRVLLVLLLLITWIVGHHRMAISFDDSDVMWRSSIVRQPTFRSGFTSCKRATGSTFSYHQGIFAALYAKYSLLEVTHSTR